MDNRQPRLCVSHEKTRLRTRCPVLGFGLCLFSAKIDMTNTGRAWGLSKEITDLKLRAAETGICTAR